VSRLIHLIRHGEPAASWGADPDPCLSALGHRQAVARAEELVSSLGSELEVWTSPMQRCRQTAAPLLDGLSIDGLIVPAVSEIPTPEGLADPRGWLTGLLHGTWDEIDAGLQSWRDGTIGAVAGISETGPPLVIFTHFIAINALVSHVTDDRRVTCFQPGHASCTVLQLSAGRLTLVSTGAEQAVVLT
jgi:broad specificity phosphatase PhoE